jgi:Fe-S-cluster containining protein
MMAPGVDPTEVLAMAGSLPVINLADAKYECIFGRGCEGICCQNGRPPVYPDEAERIDENIEKFKSEMRPEALTALEDKGYLSRRLKGGLPMLRVVDGWCIFFKEGCVLHKVGAAEGDKYRYKPAPCALFPLVKDEKDRWYIRQKDYKGESWNLFCLDPKTSPVPAAESLREELRLAEQYVEETAELKRQSAIEAQVLNGNGHTPHPNGNGHMPKAVLHDALPNEGRV